MNLPELITRLQTPGDEVFSTRQKEVIAKAIEQLAAALAAKDEALAVAEGFIDRHSEDWYISGQNDLKQVRAAKAIQPHAELVAKMKADAVIEAADEIEVGHPHITRVGASRILRE